MPAASDVARIVSSYSYVCIIVWCGGHHHVFLARLVHVCEEVFATSETKDRFEELRRPSADRRLHCPVRILRRTEIPTEMVAEGFG